MKKVKAIFENTFKESLRQKILILLIVFALLLIIVSVFLEPFALGETPKIMRDLGLAAASLFGILTTIIVGSSLIHRDVEKRTIYTVVSKPVRRGEIVLGKFLGLGALISILILAMFGIHQLVILMYEGAFEPSLFIAYPFALIEVSVILSILLLFSSFSSSTLASIMGVIFFVIGHAMPDLKLFAESTKAAALKHTAYAFYYLLPNLENFNIRTDLVHQIPLQTDQLFFSVGYGIIYTVFLLYLTTIIFERREFK